MPDKFTQHHGRGNDGFKLHCFPDLGSEPTAPAGSKPGRGGGGFRHFESENRKDSGTVSAEEMAALEARAKERESAAYDQGFAEGEKAGMAMGKEAVEPVLAQMRQILVELEKHKKQLVAHAEVEAVTLALAISRKIVHQEINTDPQVVTNTVRAALEKVADRDRIRIRLNPGDLETVQGAMGRMASLTESMASVCFDADGSIAPGGCLVESQFGEIDARIDNQMAWLEETFLAELKKAAAPGPGART